MQNLNNSLSGFVSNNKIVTKVAEEAKLKGVELMKIQRLLQGKLCLIQ